MKTPKQSFVCGLYESRKVKTLEQLMTEWNLESTLERAMDRFDVKGKSALKFEGGLLRQFQRRAHNYLQDP